MKTNKFKVTSLCHAIVTGNNRALRLYYKGEVIRYYRIGRNGGLKATLELARKDAYKSVNHSKIINHSIK